MSTQVHDALIILGASFFIPLLIGCGMAVATALHIWLTKVLK